MAQHRFAPFRPRLIAQRADMCPPGQNSAAECRGRTRNVRYVPSGSAISIRSAVMWNGTGPPSPLIATRKSGTAQLPSRSLFQPYLADRRLTSAKTATEEGEHHPNAMPNQRNSLSRDMHQKAWPRLI